MDCSQPTPFKICSAWIFFVTLDVLGVIVESSVQDEVVKHLTLGGEMLARGQLQDALSHYHAAVDGDPSNFLTYFKRGTVYLAMGKATLALTDFNKVLELKPDFIGAKYQKAQILLKQGKLDEAREAYFNLYNYDHSQDAYDNLLRIDNVLEEIHNAEAYIKEGSHVYAINILSSAIEICPWSSYLRELRSQSYVAINEPLHAVQDLRSTTKLMADNTDGYYKLSLLLYKLGYPVESLKEIRECLRLDPEHKNCFPHYKKVKKVAQHLIAAQEGQEKNDYEECALAAKKLLKAEDKVPMIIFIGQEKLCQCLLHMDQLTQAVQACSEALKISKTAELLCDRAEAYLNSEMFEEAIRDYHEAQELNPRLQRATEGLQRAQRLQKQSEKRDYYKILGVKRNANKQEITKAYRKMAQKWHPDNFSDSDKKKIAEKKFIDIAAAKEVLTDPDKRKKFDQGEDPLDPESGQHEGFNPFQQFNQFHSGGPFTFKFHFN